MPLRPLVSEFVNRDLERRVAELEQKLERIEQAISVGMGGDVTITASIINVESPMVQTSGVVQCDTIIANSVVGSSYTPGAGNVM